jgi:rhodanese-related sulfurtransferase
MVAMPKFSLTVAALLLAPVLARAEVLTAEEAKVLAGRGALTIVDVRLPVEWAATGLPEGAKGVSLQDSLTHEVRSGFLDDVLRAVGGDKDRPIALICARGNRSALARDLLAAAGFTKVDHIREGVLVGASGLGWLAHGLPTEPCKVC